MSAPETPPKEDVAKEIWRAATSLSDEMQRAAVRKARELGFDFSKGRISLEETLINLTQVRNLLVDAADKNKLAQLPLKVQNLLYSQVQKIAELLGGLVSGTDAILSLEDSVEDLTTTIWQYNLHNLSDQVLGYQNKMNQLKAQEVLIRQVHREAEAFRSKDARANELLAQIEEAGKNVDEKARTIQSSVEQAGSALAKLSELEQKVGAVTAQVEQHDTAVAQHAATTKTIAADLEAMANRARGQQAEIDSARTQFSELSGKAAQLLLSAEKSISDAVTSLDIKHEQVKADAEAKVNALRETLKTSNDAEIAALQAKGTEVSTSVSRLITDTNERLLQAETNHESKLNEQIRGFSQRADAAMEEAKSKSDTHLAEATTKTNAVIERNDAELKRLVSELDTLEGRIRESIERATGYTLFHSFQKRQLDLASSKRFWAIILAVAVGISLAASGVFIWSLQFVQTYNAAFYLKLSISLPLIYAIAFCSVQYSRERRLEEEYAFKSSISISLEPYQKLVESLVDKKQPDEVAKYTAFIIESVNRVFTSPTERIFDDQPKDRNAAENVIKAVGDLIEPLAKAIKK